MHREYLKGKLTQSDSNTLTLTGELWTYLADLNEQAQERLDTIMEQMKDAEGVTEELKRFNLNWCASITFTTGQKKLFCEIDDLFITV